MRTLLTSTNYLSPRLKRCAPLASIALPKVGYNPDILRIWLRDVAAYPEIVNTVEFQAQMRHLLHELLLDDYPDYARRQDHREDFRRAIAVQLDLQLHKDYPDLAELGSVVYRRHGGPGDPGCRFIFQPYHGGKGRGLDVVLSGYVHRSKVSSVHALRLSAQSKYIERWDKIRNAPKSGTLFIERHSGFDGFLKATAGGGRPRLNRVVNRTIHTVVSARKKTILAHPPILDALEKHAPKEVVFRNPDRLGREYYRSTLDLFADLGIDVQFLDYTAPNEHCRPWRSEIQRDNSKLDGFVLIHRKKLKVLPKRLLSCAARIRERVLIRQRDLMQMGFSLRAPHAINLKRFDNGLVELDRIILNRDRRTYLITAPP